MIPFLYLAVGVLILAIGTAVDLWWVATRTWRLARRWLP